MPRLCALPAQMFLTSSYVVLVLEYAPGGDLSHYVPRGRGVPESEARWLFQQIAFGLE